MRLNNKWIQFLKDFFPIRLSISNLMKLLKKFWTMINCLVLKLDNIHIFEELDTTNKKKTMQLIFGILGKWVWTNERRSTTLFFYNSLQLQLSRFTHNSSFWDLYFVPTFCSVMDVEVRKVPHSDSLYYLCCRGLFSLKQGVLKCAHSVMDEC